MCNVALNLTLVLAPLELKASLFTGAAGLALWDIVTVKLDFWCVLRQYRNGTERECKGYAGTHHQSVLSCVAARARSSVNTFDCTAMQ